MAFSLGQIVCEPETVAVGFGLIGIVVFCEPPLLQLPFDTVQFKITEPLAFAVNVMVRVPAPAVIEPPLIDQLYVGVPPAVGTDALLPVELEQTDDGALMVESGTARIVNVRVNDAAVPHEFAMTTS